MLHLVENFCHVFHALPYVLRHINGAAFLEGDGEAIARARIDLNDLFLSELILHVDDEPSIKDTVVEIVDHHALNFRSQTLEDASNQVVGLRTFSGHLFQGHGDRRAHSRVYIDDEDFVSVPQKHSTASVCREDCANFGGDDLMGTHRWLTDHGGNAIRRQGGFMDRLMNFPLVSRKQAGQDSGVCRVLPPFKRKILRTMAYAIIKTGGKQYRVSEGQHLDVEKLDLAVGDQTTLSEVLFYSDGSAANIGDPMIEGASVAASVIEQFRDKKVIAFKFKRRKGYHKTKGHRRHLTRLRIDSISA